MSHINGSPVQTALRTRHVFRRHANKQRPSDKAVHMTNNPTGYLKWGKERRTKKKRKKKYNPTHSCVKPASLPACLQLKHTVYTVSGLGSLGSPCFTTSQTKEMERGTPSVRIHLGHCIEMDCIAMNCSPKNFALCLDCALLKCGLSFSSLT